MNRRLEQARREQRAKHARARELDRKRLEREAAPEVLRIENARQAPGG